MPRLTVMPSFPSCMQGDAASTRASFAVVSDGERLDDGSDAGMAHGCRLILVYAKLVLSSVVSCIQAGKVCCWLA